MIQMSNFLEFEYDTIHYTEHEKSTGASNAFDCIWNPELFSRIAWESHDVHIMEYTSSDA
jgi:hypothetical protein